MSYKLWQLFSMFEAKLKWFYSIIIDVFFLFGEEIEKKIKKIANIVCCKKRNEYKIKYHEKK